jgi:hypothetical protein
VGEVDRCIAVSHLYVEGNFGLNQVVRKKKFREELEKNRSFVYVMGRMK